MKQLELSGNTTYQIEQGIYILLRILISHQPEALDRVQEFTQKMRVERAVEKSAARAQVRLPGNPFGQKF